MRVVADGQTGQSLEQATSGMENPLQKTSPALQLISNPPSTRVSDPGRGNVESDGTTSALPQDPTSLSQNHAGSTEPALSESEYRHCCVI